MFSLEEETERADGANDDGEDDEGDGTDELALVLASGDVAPGATVTVQVLAGGSPVENATVRANDERVGTTGAGGTVTFVLPASGDVEVVATSGDAEDDLDLSSSTGPSETTGSSSRRPVWMPPSTATR